MKKEKIKLIVYTLCSLIIMLILPIKTFLTTIINVYVIMGFAVLGIVFTITSYLIVNNHQEDNKGSKIVMIINEYYQVIIMAVLFIELVFGFIAFPGTVNQTSMTPTLQENERIIVVNTHNYEYGDIIVFQYDNTIQRDISSVANKTLLVKRVLACPNDTFYIENGITYINGSAKTEYGSNNNKTFDLLSVLEKNNIDLNLFEKASDDQENYVIPEGWYLVLGDNRNNSIDSEEFGLIHKSQILGEAKYKWQGILRFSKIGKDK